MFCSGSWASHPAASNTAAAASRFARLTRAALRLARFASLGCARWRLASLRDASSPDLASAASPLGGARAWLRLARFVSLVGTRLRHASLRDASSPELASAASPLDLAHALRLAAALLLCFAPGALPARGQDVGNANDAFHGNGAEITVTLRDASGQLISAPATIRLLRNGAIPSGQAATSRGRLVFQVTGLGDFTVIAEAVGYRSEQKVVSVPVTERTQVDVYMQRESDSGTVAGVPGRPLLAPKAKEAFDKGLLALSANKLGDAEKHATEAMRLAPGHPDVLYLQGVLDLKRRNFAGAQEALEKATQVDPGHARAFAALGMALADQGKYADAIAPLEKSLSLDAGAGAWETHWVLAKAYYQHEQYDDALKTSQAALADSSGKAPEIALLVAQSLTAVGRYEDAAAVLRDFVKSHGDRSEAATARRWLEKLTASGKIAANR
jgi:tetratricopeptide (TPR) repeat protein